MTVAGVPDKRTALFSPFPLDEESMARIEANGAPAFLVVPNGGRRFDVRPMKARYPTASVVSAPGAKVQVGEASPVDTTSEVGKHVDLVSVAGMGDSELALVVRHEGGTSLVTNDIIGNVARPEGLAAWLRALLTGFGPRPAVPRLVSKNYVRVKQRSADSLPLGQALRTSPPGPIAWGGDRPSRAGARTAREVAGGVKYSTSDCKTKPNRIFIMTIRFSFV